MPPGPPKPSTPSLAALKALDALNHKADTSSDLSSLESRSDDGSAAPSAPVGLTMTVKKSSRRGTRSLSSALSPVDSSSSTEALNRSPVAGPSSLKGKGKGREKVAAREMEKMRLADEDSLSDLTDQEESVQGSEKGAKEEKEEFNVFDGVEINMGKGRAGASKDGRKVSDGSTASSRSRMRNDSASQTLPPRGTEEEALEEDSDDDEDQQPTSAPLATRISPSHINGSSSKPSKPNSSPNGHSKSSPPKSAGRSRAPTLLSPSRRPVDVGESDDGHISQVKGINEAGPSIMGRRSSNAGIMDGAGGMDLDTELPKEDEDEEGDEEEERDQEREEGMAVPSIEVDGDEEMEDGAVEEEEDGVEEEADEEADPAMNRKTSSHHPPEAQQSLAHRLEAMEALAKIEIAFARIRDRLYVERMEECWREEAKLADGTHPSHIFHLSLLSNAHSNAHSLSSLRHSHAVAQIEKTQAADEESVWSWWAERRESLRAGMMEDVMRKRRRVDREKRAVEGAGRPLKRTLIDPALNPISTRPPYVPPVSTHSSSSGHQHKKRRMKLAPEKAQFQNWMPASAAAWSGLGGVEGAERDRDLEALHIGAQSRYQIFQNQFEQANTGSSFDYLHRFVQPSQPQPYPHPGHLHQHQIQQQQQQQQQLQQQQQQQMMHLHASSPGSNIFPPRQQHQQQAFASYPTQPQQSQPPPPRHHPNHQQQLPPELYGYPTPSPSIPSRHQHPPHAHPQQPSQAQLQAAPPTAPSAAPQTNTIVLKKRRSSHSPARHQHSVASHGPGGSDVLAQGAFEGGKKTVEGHPFGSMTMMSGGGGGKKGGLGVGGGVGGNGW